MAEEKKIENAVYEYDVLEERTERRPAAVTPYEREICQHMEGLFPHRVTRVYREIDSEFLSVNVFVMKAPTKKDFHVLYTTGMSAMPMKLPQEFLPKYKDLERAELLLFLPAEWDILTGYETDADVPDRLWWPVRLMKYLARFPHEFKTWLGWGHTRRIQPIVCRMTKVRSFAARCSEHCRKISACSVRRMIRRLTCTA